MNTTKQFLSMAIVLALTGLTEPVTAQQGMQAFALSEVQLLESPFVQAQQADLTYIMSLDPDRLLAPFLKEACLQPDADSYGNWENTGLDGHIGGHYLSALANMYAATRNAVVLSRLNYMIGKLEQCQLKNGNGYIGGVPGSAKFWADIANGKIEAGGFSLNGKWVPWYNMHKLFAGLVDAYHIAGIVKAREMVIKLSDWCLITTQNLSEVQMQNMLRCEHGGMNEALADVAVVSGDDKYLQLAKRFSHQAILNPLLKYTDALTGMHANTQIPKVIGFMRIAEINADKAWAAASDFFWQTVVSKRTISFGGNSVREHFNPVTDFSSMLESREGPETCNSYNMLKLSKHLFLQDPLARYMDYYERTVYNHILSSQHPDGGFVYFTPIRPRHYRVYSQAQKDFWCCVGSGIENHGKYGEMIYAYKGEDLFVNLFIPSVLNWKQKQRTITQHTAFPDESATRLKLTLKKAEQFTVHIRKPSWLKGNRIEVLLNSKKQVYIMNEDGYVSISRLWNNGDVITVALPMHTAIEQLPDGSPWVSFVHGPIVLAAKTDTTGLKGMYADGSRSGHIANGPLYPLDEAPVFVSDEKDLASKIRPVAGKPMEFKIAGSIYPQQYSSLTLVPFYRLHSARYMIYWPFTSKAGLESRQEKVRVADSLERVLERQTIDRVLPGEQQPESDHGFTGAQTESGIHNGRHWRHATGWFGYQLRNSSGDARKLRVTYWGQDRNRNFDILLNDQLLARVSLDGKGGAQFIEIDYPLPETVNTPGNPVVYLKFRAAAGSTAGGIYDIRLMR